MESGVRTPTRVSWKSRIEVPVQVSEIFVK